MHQDSESVVEVPKALSVEVSQIGAFALQRAARLRIAQPLRAWLEENGRPRANNLADWASGGAEISCNMSGLSSKDPKKRVFRR
ncbi:hypothetical protein [Mesorhizobium loti]|uniref:Uncharacterized protein n=1 Tax=Rhizobium loti TaxID=381 RepID=A0A1A5PV53_RHILI|nr:hypothetical protein [Mesorhizobium loti]OBP80074.1 hypothetical protein BAE39_27590 [Mesorhizobium loti]OBQ59134.1 hypothetical protein A8145_26210 [Mesorhizobium loti]QKC73277.1 hypothetical protein EB815_32310 [Mesorhizobium loti]